MNLFSKMKCISLAFAVLASFQGLAQNIPKQGVYKGQIEVTSGAPVQMSLQIRISNVDVPSDPGDVLPFKKQMVGTFTIENEAGPYGLNYVNYNIAKEKNNFDLYYVRPTAGSAAGSSTTPTSPPLVYALHFSAQYKNGVISGRVDSGLRGDLGPFKLTLTTQEKTLSVKPNFGVGSWHGQLVYASQHTDSFDLNISPAVGTQTNPADLELDNTPGRIGSIFLDGVTVIPFSQIYIDYFTHAIRMYYTNSVTGASLTLNAIVSPEAIDGTFNSAYIAKPGSFKTVRKVE
jgi:hypothetical protein